jgi:hypothetical protein
LHLTPELSGERFATETGWKRRSCQFYNGVWDAALAPAQDISNKSENIGVIVGIAVACAIVIGAAGVGAAGTLLAKLRGNADGEEDASGDNGASAATDYEKL